jgi:hypothetical protein
MQQHFLGFQFPGDIFLDQIYLSAVGRPGQLLAVVLAAVAVIVLVLRLGKNRRRNVSERRNGYNCVSASLAWGSSDDPVDSRAQQLLADSAARRAGSAVKH